MSNIPQKDRNQSRDATKQDRRTLEHWKLGAILVSGYWVAGGFALFALSLPVLPAFLSPSLGSASAAVLSFSWSFQHFCWPFCTFTSIHGCFPVSWNEGPASRWTVPSQLSSFLRSESIKSAGSLVLEEDKPTAVEKGRVGRPVQPQSSNKGRRWNTMTTPNNNSCCLLSAAFIEHMYFCNNKAAAYISTTQDQPPISQECCKLPSQIENIHNHIGYRTFLQLSSQRMNCQPVLSHKSGEDMGTADWKVLWGRRSASSCGNLCWHRQQVRPHGVTEYRRHTPQTDQRHLINAYTLGPPAWFHALRWGWRWWPRIGNNSSDRWHTELIQEWQH